MTWFNGQLRWKTDRFIVKLCTALIGLGMGILFAITGHLLGMW